MEVRITVVEDAGGINRRGFDWGGWKRGSSLLNVLKEEIIRLFKTNDAWCAVFSIYSIFIWVKEVIYDDIDAWLLYKKSSFLSGSGTGFCLASYITAIYTGELINKMWKKGKSILHVITEVLLAKNIYTY